MKILNILDVAYSLWYVVFHYSLLADLSASYRMRLQCGFPDKENDFKSVN